LNDHGWEAISGVADLGHNGHVRPQITVGKPNNVTMPTTMSRTPLTRYTSSLHRPFRAVVRRIFGFENGTSLYDAMEPEFTVLRFDRTIEVAPLEAAASKRGLPLKVLDVDIIDRLDTAGMHGGSLILSRPDQHVAWRGDNVPEHPMALIDRVRGAA
jgi:hypothetical protein